MGVPGKTNSFQSRFEAAVGALPLANRRLIVAFSGGLDSTLLLHALHRQARGLKLTAIHFDHGLHPESADWSAHCMAVAESLGVDFVTRQLDVQRAPGESLEAVAREARYAALTEVIGAGDIVFTAHHADDQLETVLMRLLRGTGVRGLTAIHTLSELGDGLLARPLLDFTRAEIEAEASRLGLKWLDDPSNVDMRFDRNFLRARILPILRERWPGAGLTASRLARQMAEAETVLGEVAAVDLALADDFEQIAIERLSALSEARLNNALRYAIRARRLPVPNAVQLAELRRALGARKDAEVIVSWPGGQARIYRRQLYLLPPGEGAAAKRGRIDTHSAFKLGDGELRLVPSDDYGIPDRWARDGLDVAFRVGGERFRPRGSRHHRQLKQWFQEAGIVPWMRGAVPLLYHDDELVAVADICLAADLPQEAGDGPFWRPVWSGHASLR
jgi:tRNA(Ile)-lysidine synthase